MKRYLLVTPALFSFFILTLDAMAGIAVPGLRLETNAYYWIKDGKLLRGVCEKNLVPTVKNCPADQHTPDAEALLTSLENKLTSELTEAQNKLDSAISQAVGLDPEVVVFTEKVYQQKKLADNMNIALQVLKKMRGDAEVSLAIVNAQLATITERLADATEEELPRLKSLEKSFLKQKSELAVDIQTQSAKIDELQPRYDAVKELFAEMSIDLGDLRGNVDYSGPNIEAAQALVSSLKDQLALMPEVNARLADSLTYPMSSFEEAAAPDLLARFPRLIQESYTETFYRLNETDRNQILHQQICPVSQELLGSKTPPVQVISGHRYVWVNNDSSADIVRRDFKRYWKIVNPGASAPQ